jgi:hypothetical protein
MICLSVFGIGTSVEVVTLMRTDATVPHYLREIKENMRDKEVIIVVDSERMKSMDTIALQYLQWREDTK